MSDSRVDQIRPDRLLRGDASLENDRRRIDRRSPEVDRSRSPREDGDRLVGGDDPTLRDPNTTLRAPRQDLPPPDNTLPARDLVRRAGTATEIGERTRALSGRSGAVRAPDQIAPPPPPPLRDRLSRALPAGRFDQPWQRDRILDRAAQFERRVREISRDGRTLPALRRTMGANFDANTPIEFHGVASHFGPETMQAHARDRAGNLHVYTQDSAGNWVARRDLADRVRRGQIPSTDPGLQRGPNGTATFGIARPQADGSYRFDVPDVRNFDHTPRVRPFNTGDTVQLTAQTGNAEVRREGQPHVPQERVELGRIVANDGRGNWTVEMTNADGTARNGPDGRPIRRQVTDADLRRMNNPNFLRDGDRVHGDMRFDSRDANQRRMLSDWRASREYRDAMARRPAAGATPDQRAAWEREMITAGERFLDRTMRYPSASNTERQQWRDRIGAIDRELRGLPADGERARTLNTERTRLQGQLDRAERDNREVTRLDGEIRRLQGDLDRARREGRATDALQRQLDTARTARTAAQTRVDQDRRYHATLQAGGNPPPSIGDYYVNGTGACRHQAVAMQALMQDMGIDSRLTRGAANTEGGDYRGEHLWLEATLSNGQHMMVDPTWSTVDDLRRIYEGSPSRREVPRETEQRSPGGYRDSLVFDDTLRPFGLSAI